VRSEQSVSSKKAEDTRVKSIEKKMNFVL
jgi:hypothetical protein